MEVPKECLTLWERAGDAQALLTYLSAIKGALAKAQDEKDELFVEVDFNASLANVKQLYADLERAKPYAVCPTCQGKLFKTCLSCKGRGFVSQFYWSNIVSQEVKDMRKKL